MVRDSDAGVGCRDAVYPESSSQTGLEAEVIGFLFMHEMLTCVCNVFVRVWIVVACHSYQ